METKRLTFDVFGRRMMVEATTEDWTAFYLGSGGKRRPANIAIPAHLDGPGIAQYLDDLFHEAATVDHPTVQLL